MLEIVDNLINRVEVLLIAAVSAQAIWFVAWTWFRTRSVVPVISALLVGAVMVWGVTNYVDVEGYVGRDAEELDGDG